MLAWAAPHSAQGPRLPIYYSNSVDDAGHQGIHTPLPSSTPPSPTPTRRPFRHASGLLRIDERVLRVNVRAVAHGCSMMVLGCSTVPMGHRQLLLGRPPPEIVVVHFMGSLRTNRGHLQARTQRWRVQWAHVVDVVRLAGLSLVQLRCYLEGVLPLRHSRLGEFPELPQRLGALVVQKLNGLPFRDPRAFLLPPAPPTPASAPPPEELPPRPEVHVSYSAQRGGNPGRWAASRRAGGRAGGGGGRGAGSGRAGWGEDGGGHAPRLPLHPLLVVLGLVLRENPVPARVPQAVAPRHLPRARERESPGGPPPLPPSFSLSLPLGH